MLLIIDKPFKRVGIHLDGPIDPPSEDGHRYILTLVDFATRYPEAVPLKNILNIDTETVAEALVHILSRLSNVWLHSSVGRASHRYRGGHGFESR